MPRRGGRCAVGPPRLADEGGRSREGALTAKAAGRCARRRNGLRRPVDRRRVRRRGRSFGAPQVPCGLVAFSASEDGRRRARGAGGRIGGGFRRGPGRREVNGGRIARGHAARAGRPSARVRPRAGLYGARAQCPRRRLVVGWGVRPRARCPGACPWCTRRRGLRLLGVPAGHSHGLRLDRCGVRVEHEPESDGGRVPHRAQPGDSDAAHRADASRGCAAGPRVGRRPSAAGSRPPGIPVGCATRRPFSAAKVRELGRALRRLRQRPRVPPPHSCDRTREATSTRAVAPRAWSPLHPRSRRTTSGGGPWRKR